MKLKDLNSQMEFLGIKRNDNIFKLLSKPNMPGSFFFFFFFFFGKEKEVK